MKKQLAVLLTLALLFNMLALCAAAAASGDGSLQFTPAAAVFGSPRGVLLRENHVRVLPGVTAAALLAQTSGAQLRTAAHGEVDAAQTVKSGMYLLPESGNAVTIAVQGDLDGDGLVSAADARLALRASVELETLSPWQREAADVNGQQTLTSDQARTLLRASVGLEDIAVCLSSRINAFYAQITLFNSPRVYYRGTSPADEWSDAANMEYAATENTLYILSEVNFGDMFGSGKPVIVRLGLFIDKDNDVHLVDPEGRAKLKLDDKLLNSMGIEDISDLFGDINLLKENPLTPESIPSFVEPALLDGNAVCRSVFLFEDGSATRFYAGADGRLLYTDTLSVYGSELEGTYITSITADVPANMQRIPLLYTHYRGETQLLLFLINLFAHSGINIGELIE